MRWRLCEKVNKAFSNININDKLKHYSYNVVDDTVSYELVHIFTTRQFIGKERNFDFYNSGHMRFPGNYLL